MPDFGSADWNMAAQLGSTALNGINAAKTDSKDKQWIEHIRKSQRSWALDDWNMQNQYNSPAEQMRRMKEAGLNPNLIYGRMDSSAAGAVRSSDALPMKHRQTDFSGLQNAVGGYQDAQLKVAQLDNLHQQNKLLQAQTDYTNARVPLTGAQEENTRFNTDRGRSMLPESLEGLQLKNDLTREDIKKRQADTAFTIDENERQRLKNISDLKTATQVRANYMQQRIESSSRMDQQFAQTKQIYHSIDLMKENLHLAEKNNVLKDWEVQLSKSGLTPTDNRYWRVVQELADQLRQKLLGKKYNFDQLKNTPR